MLQPMPPPPCSQLPRRKNMMTITIIETKYNVCLRINGCMSLEVPSTAADALLHP